MTISRSRPKDPGPNATADELEEYRDALLARADRLRVVSMRLSMFGAIVSATQVVLYAAWRMYWPMVLMLALLCCNVYTYDRTSKERQK